MKKTAVEWFVEEFKEKLTGNNLPNWVLDIIQQAKAMEKEQIEKAYLDGFVERQFSLDCKAEQYYNETFKK